MNCYDPCQSLATFPFIRPYNSTGAVTGVNLFVTPRLQASSLEATYRVRDSMPDETRRRIVDLSRRRDSILEALMLDLEALAILAADYEVRGGQPALRGGGTAEEAGTLPRKSNIRSLVINKKLRRKAGHSTVCLTCEAYMARFLPGKTQSKNRDIAESG